MQLYSIYILWSDSSQIFYIGYSSNPDERILFHNQISTDSFTSKHRPWIKKAKLLIGDNKNIALKIEKYIKKRKSIDFINLCILKQNDLEFIQYLINKVAQRQSPVVQRD